MTGQYDAGGCKGIKLNRILDVYLWCKFRLLGKRFLFGFFVKKYSISLLDEIKLNKFTSGHLRYLYTSPSHNV